MGVQCRCVAVLASHYSPISLSGGHVSSLAPYSHQYSPSCWKLILLKALGSLGQAWLFKHLFSVWLACISQTWPGVAAGSGRSSQWKRTTSLWDDCTINHRAFSINHSRWRGTGAGPWESRRPRACWVHRTAADAGCVGGQNVHGVPFRRSRGRKTSCWERWDTDLEVWEIHLSILARGFNMP